MKSIFEITRYKIRQLLSSSKYITPLIFFTFLLYSIYSEASNSIIATFTVTLTVQFIISVWIGKICNELEHDVIEQLIILKVKKKFLYHVSEIFMHFCLSSIMSAIVMLYPTALYLVHSETVQFSDIGYGILLHIFVGVMGLGVGSFFHSRIIKNRKSITILVIIVTLLSFAKGSIAEEHEFLKIIMWIMPPMSEILQQIKGEMAFTAQIMLNIIFMAIAYYIIQKLLKSMLLNKTKF